MTVPVHCSQFSHAGLCIHNRGHMVPMCGSIPDNELLQASIFCTIPLMKRLTLQQSVCAVELVVVLSSLPGIRSVPAMVH